VFMCTCVQRMAETPSGHQLKLILSEVLLIPETRNPKPETHQLMLILSEALLFPEILTLILSEKFRFPCIV
jgi:hypothetical protein